MTLLSAASVLFLVMDPFGNVPMFLAILEPYSAKRRQRIVLRELFIALLVLLLFLYFGRFMLHALNISENSMSVAGGVILFLIALRMVFPESKAVEPQQGERLEPLIVPLAIPLIAGPSAMATAMLVMTNDPSRWLTWTLALLLAWLLSGTVLFLGVSLSRFLGRRGLMATERLMGMILTAIAVDMVLEGIIKFVASVPGSG